MPADRKVTDIKPYNPLWPLEITKLFLPLIFNINYAASSNKFCLNEHNVCQSRATERLSHKPQKVHRIHWQRSAVHLLRAREQLPEWPSKTYQFETRQWSYHYSLRDHFNCWKASANSKCDKQSTTPFADIQRNNVQRFKEIKLQTRVKIFLRISKSTLSWPMPSVMLS